MASDSPNLSWQAVTTFWLTKSFFKNLLLSRP